MQTIYKVRKQINRKLQIDGILLTMVDRRTNFSKEIIELLHDNYGEYINIFKTAIPFSIRAAETSAEGVFINTIRKVVLPKLIKTGRGGDW